MNTCYLFRERLEQALRNRPDFERLRVLGWHEHLFGCTECRSLLEAEEALEALIGVLPEVELPADLASRVLARLESLRIEAGDCDAGELAKASLDGLLEQDRELAAPAGLGARTYLAICAQREEAALDRVLEHLPKSAAPEGLAQGVLARLRVEHVDQAERIHRTRAPRFAWAAAALALAGLALALAGTGFWLFGRHAAPLDSGSGPEDRLAVDSEADEPEVDPDLLASLDLLENWELLMSDDVDVFLGSLGSIGELGVGADSLLEASLGGFDFSEGEGR